MIKLIEEILSTTDPQKLEHFWNEYNSELNKIIFKQELIDGRDKVYKILQDSFNIYKNNCIQGSGNTFDTKDLVFSFANMTQMIELNKI